MRERQRRLLTRNRTGGSLQVDPARVAFEDLADCVFEDVLQPMLARAEVLAPGTSITRRVSDPKLGDVEIIFTAR